MEDNRDAFIMLLPDILAYWKHFQIRIPVLKSCFSQRILFEDYTINEELLSIFENSAGNTV